MSFWAWLADILGAGRYSQHSICLTNDLLMITLYTISETVIWLSYFILGASLVTSYKHGISLKPEIKLLFGMFIFLCGAQHATSLLTLYVGVYRLDVVVKVATAAVSFVTALVTLRGLKADPDERPRASVRI